jgi:hypothetical protein
VDGIAAALRASTWVLASTLAILACGGESSNLGSDAADDAGGGRSGASTQRGGSSTGAVGATGATSSQYCNPIPGVCTLGGTLSTYTRPVGNPCDIEGNVCQGTYCNDVYSASSYKVACCGGKWSTDIVTQNGVETCRRPLVAGDPYACPFDVEAMCSVGETHCSEERRFGVEDVTTACLPLCAASDCSCFCTPDVTGGCSFEDEPGSGLKGFCSCSWVKAPVLQGELGSIQVVCELVTAPEPGTCEPYPDLDVACADLGIGTVCADSVQPGEGCVPMGSAGDVYGYCCPG